MYHIFFIHSSVNGHLGCFHVLTVVNSATMNTGRHVSFQIMFFSEYMPSSRIAGSIFSFLRNLQLFSTVAVPVYIPTSGVQKCSPFSTSCPPFIIYRCLDDGHPVPCWLSWSRIHLQCRKPQFDSWVGKIPGEGIGYLFQYS